MHYISFSFRTSKIILKTGRRVRNMRRRVRWRAGARGNRIEVRTSKFTSLHARSVIMHTSMLQAVALTSVQLSFPTSRWHYGGVL